MRGGLRFFHTGISLSPLTISRERGTSGRLPTLGRAPADTVSSALLATVPIALRSFR